MNGCLEFYIIGHIEQGSQRRDMSEHPLEHPRPRESSNLGPLVYKSSVLTTGPHWLPQLSHRFTVNVFKIYDANVYLLKLLLSYSLP